MILKKWNYQKHKYDPYEIPDEWNVNTYSSNLDDVINCAKCGKKVKFGDTYSSKEIHTNFGMGFCVCEKCHNIEMTKYLINKGCD